MSKPKFTKGDLYVVQVGDVNYIDTETGFTFAQAFCEYDAHLIAAAPEMYTMLERALELIPIAGESEKQDKLRFDILDLLAKARGEE